MQEHLPDDFDRLTRGAFDLHVHGQPDLSRALPNRGDDVAVARLAVEYGLRGWVLKSHVWPTTDRAAAIQREFDPAAFAVLGSITLNPPTGGLSPASVELAAAHGARMVFLPTWGAAAELARDGYVSRLLRSIVGGFDAFASSAALTVLDGDGRLTPDAASIVAICADRGLTIGTGHLSLRESSALVERAAELGARIVVNHPLHYAESVGDLVELAGLGAFIEFSAAPLLHPDAASGVRAVHAGIAELGSGQVVLTSDAFSRWAPAAPEALRILLEQLAYLGCTADELAAMAVRNPARAIGIAAPDTP
ncbi:MAG: hypothetical protein J7480_00845 [Microbacteriaceae bacterium]|nr:hypothetical protein [Microbacteriaceae bacterium]